MKFVYLLLVWAVCGWRKCGTLEGGLAMYATGNSCEWSGAAGRARAIKLTAKQIGAL